MATGGIVLQFVRCWRSMLEVWCFSPFSALVFTFREPAQSLANHDHPASMAYETLSTGHISLCVDNSNVVASPNQTADRAIREDRPLRRRRIVPRCLTRRLGPVHCRDHSETDLYSINI